MDVPTSRPAARFRPEIERLGDRITPDAGGTPWDANFGVILAAEDAGSPVLTVFDRHGGEHPLQAYDGGFTGGVRFAVGDVTGDGVADIVTAAGPGGGPHVKVFDGRTATLVRSFYAFDPSFSGGVEVAVGDVNRDGVDDIITGAGPGGGPNVRVFDGRTGAKLTDFQAFDPAFRGGVFVAAGDLNRDGYDDVVVGAGTGGGPRVTAFDLRTGKPLLDFFPFESSFRGGARVAAADVNGDGIDDVITGAGPGGGPRVRVFDVSGGSVLSDRFAGDPAVTTGVRVSAVDLDQDGHSEVTALTRTGDLAAAAVYEPDSAAATFSAWVGVGAPPAGTTTSVSTLPSFTGSFDPIRTLTGTIQAVAADHSAMTLRKGDGTAVEIDLDGDPPLPSGMISIDTPLLGPAEIVSGDRTLTAASLTVGAWVRVTVARARDAAADHFTATSVRLL